MIADVEELEERLRRRDLRVDDDTLYAFYDERVPADVVSTRHFDAWWKKHAGQARPADVRPGDAVARADDADDEFPREWHSGATATPSR